MATPFYGTATFQGLQTKATYSVDVYCSDAAGPVNWDSGSGATATSLTFWKAPEDVVLVDLSFSSAATMVVITPTSNGGLIPGQKFRFANFLNTLAFRPAIKLGFRGGNNIGLIQA